MKLLLDTHIFLWFISADARLPSPMQRAIQDSSNDVYLSVVSVWEAIIKYHLGKLPLPEAAELYLPKQRELHRIASLELDERSVAYLPTLPSLHRDPFDRMLICQAFAFHLTLMSRDDQIRMYPAQLFDENQS